MYSAKDAFASSERRHLRGIPSTVLRLNLTSVNLPLPPITGPARRGSPADPRIFSTFNPSISLAPGHLRRLCSRCAYVMALRADTLHQCNASSPLLQRQAVPSLFKGTALLVLDAELGIVEWTWLLARPDDQISISHGSSRWFVWPGVSGGFPPPWAKRSYDTRRPIFEEEILTQFMKLIDRLVGCCSSTVSISSPPQLALGATSRCTSSSSQRSRRRGVASATSARGRGSDSVPRASRGRRVGTRRSSAARSGGAVGRKRARCTCFRPRRPTQLASLHAPLLRSGTCSHGSVS